MREKYQKIYDEFKNGEKDKRLEELKAKIESKTATQVEYKEAKAIEKAKQNIQKVDAIIKLQEKLKSEAEKIEKEILARERKTKLSEELDKEAEKLETELSNLETERENISKELKNATGENKAVLIVKLKETELKIEKNNEKYQKNLKTKLNIQEIEKDDNEHKEISLDDLNNKYNELQNKASKCNLAIINLLKGRNWDDIEQKLDNYQNRKFTINKDKNIKKDKENTESNKGISDKELEDIEKNLSKKAEEIENKARKEIEQEEILEVEESSLVEQSKFAKRFPRLAKIGNWFKSIFNKNKNVSVEEKGNIEKENIEKETVKNTTVENKNNKYEQRTVDEIINSNENNFKKYLKEISEKGYDEYIKETTETRTAEKLKEAKKQAYERETKKFGEEYAKKSYNKKEDEEIEK